MKKKYFAIGAVSAAIAVALGAFGAHGLEGRLTERYLTIFETGVRYHMYAALAIMIAAIASAHLKQEKLLLNGLRLLLAGKIVFSGTLYILSLTGFGKLGMITPLGGVAFVAGFICLAVAALRSKDNTEAM